MMKAIALSEYELNIVLSALAKLPYEQSAATIENIMKQTEEVTTNE